MLVVLVLSLTLIFYSSSHTDSTSRGVTLWRRLYASHSAVCRLSLSSLHFSIDQWTLLGDSLDMTIRVGKHCTVDMQF